MSQTTTLVIPTFVAIPRLRRIVLLALLALAGGFAALWGWEYWSAQAQFHLALAAVHARGETTSLAEIVEALIQDNPKESGAVMIAKAADKNAEMESYERLGDDNPDMDPNYRTKHPEPRIDAAVQKRIQGAGEVLDLLEAASRRPPGMLAPAACDKPLMERVPTTVNLGGLTRLLAWVAYDALARGDVDLAYRTVWLRLTLDEHGARDPSFVSHMLRMGRVSQSCELLSLSLRHARLEERRFRQIDAQLARWDDGFDLEPSLRFLRAEYLASLDDDRAMDELLEFRLDHWGPKGGVEAAWQRSWWSIYRSPISLPTLLHEKAAFLRVMDRVIRTVDDPRANWGDTQAAVNAFKARSPFSHVIGSQFPPSGAQEPLMSHQGVSGLEALGHTARRAHRRLILARLALRLRRHFDNHGRLPEKLEDLCDDAMPKIRLEWFQNQPIVYKPSQRGFRLEVPDSILPPAERNEVLKTPVPSDYGLEIEFKSLPTSKGGKR